MRNHSCKRALGCFVFAVSLTVSAAAGARDAAFLDPGLTNGNSGAAPDAVTVEPKNDIDLGESSIGVARRVVTFFVNQTSVPVEILGVVVNGDSNITSSIVSDDCSKENKIAPNSRCSIVTSVTPTSTGIWSSEIMMTHKASGRIARQRIFGRATVPPGTSDRKDLGLSLSNKEVAPVNFGEVEAGTSRAVRSALMINDSQDPLTIMSIDLIAAENGLERLDQGCSIDMELKAGESCPITLMWKPVNKGTVSTDLIIRHTGKMGFVVIPIRGISKESSEQAAKSSLKEEPSKETKKSARSGSDHTPMPPTADELEQMASGKIPQVSSGDMGSSSGVSSGRSGFARSPSVDDTSSFRLIGTVGNRAILLTPDGSTSIAGVDEEVPWGEGRIAKVISLAPKSVEIFIDGKKKKLSIGAASELTSKATPMVSSSRSSDGTKAIHAPVSETKR